MNSPKVLALRRLKINRKSYKQLGIKIVESHMEKIILSAEKDATMYPQLAGDLLTRIKVLIDIQCNMYVKSLP